MAQQVKAAIHSIDPKLKDVRSIGELFFVQSKRYGDKPLFRHKVKRRWVDTSWRQASEIVRSLAATLRDFGIGIGDKIAILSENRPEWALSDLAILTLGGIVVPVYATETPEHIAYIVEHSESKAIFVSNKTQLAKLIEMQDQISFLDRVIVFDEEGVELNEGILPWDVLVKNMQSPLSDDELKECSDWVVRDDLATIIYTSGTTGVPKGVMLTHGNLTSNAIELLSNIPMKDDAVLLSFLPLSHIFERTVGYYSPLCGGATIAYAESIDKLPENFKEIKPHLIISVPRVYEKMFLKIKDGLRNAPALRRKIFEFAIGVGSEALKREFASNPVPFWLKVRYSIADKLVFRKVKVFFGGRLEFAVSGGAPLSKDIAEFFASLGLVILEGYGLTETSPAVSANSFNKRKLGTVGLALSGVEVRLAEDCELLVKGPNIMKGYYKMDEKTKAVLEPDGWLHTGDIADIDEDGFIKIVDRKKDIIITAGGKNIPPQPIENLLKTHSIIGDVCVVGDKHKFISALIVPNLDECKKVMEGEESKNLNNQELIKHPKVQTAVQSVIDEVNKKLARFETVKRFTLISNPFSLETGEITPTLKVKRKVVIDQYISLIDQLYKDENASA